MHYSLIKYPVEHNCCFLCLIYNAIYGIIFVGKDHIINALDNEGSGGKTFYISSFVCVGNDTDRLQEPPMV